MSEKGEWQGKGTVPVVAVRGDNPDMTQLI